MRLGIVDEGRGEPFGKRRTYRPARNSLVGFAELLQRVLPELGPQRATEAASTTIVLVGALWTHTHPSQAVLDAYASDPVLAVIPGPFTHVLERAISVVLTGSVHT